MLNYGPINQGLLGYQPEELIGEHYTSVIHDEDVMFPGDIPGKDISVYRLNPKTRKKGR